ncbi:MAG TPA: AAA family ATPase, partial [Friedmanniella sp.]
MNLKRIFRGPLIWIVLAVIAVGVLIDFSTRLSGGYKEAPTSTVVAIINGTEPLTEVTLIDREQTIEVTTKDTNQRLKATWVGDQSGQLIDRLNQRVADKTLDTWQGENPQPSFLSNLLATLIPFILIAVVFFFLLNSVQGGGSRVMQFGKSKAKVANKDTPKTTFADVAGADEAVEELQEIKEFLAEPAKFQAVGAKIPKGVLLYGQPGTGKTLLARAVAGEAGVPFFSISGSDFVEMFVGVGASRVR